MSSKAGETKGSASDLEGNADQPSPPKKVCFSQDDFTQLSKDELTEKWKEIEKYLVYLEEERKESPPEDGPLAVRSTEERVKVPQDSTPRENVLVMRLATKEQEIQELLAQINELKHSQNPATSQLRSTLLDPAVNILFERMKKELTESKEKLEQAQNDLSAWKFTPDSVTGKKLMAKCRMLIQENQDLGKQLSQGRLAQLEAELALQKKYSEELKGSQDELNEFVIQLDEEVEGMQSTICVLQQQLKDCKAELQKRTEEVESLNVQLNFSTNNRNSPKHQTTYRDNTDPTIEKRTNVDVTEDKTVENRTNCHDEETLWHSSESLDATDSNKLWDDTTDAPSRTISVIQHGVDAKTKTPSPPKGHKVKTPMTDDVVSEKETVNHKLRTKELKDLEDHDEGGGKTNDGEVLSDCNGELVAVGDR